jgi:hypothetical protein
MNQFNQAAAERIAKDCAQNHGDQLMIINAIYLYFEALPTPEVIEFDLEKLKTGEYTVTDYLGELCEVYGYVGGFFFVKFNYNDAPVCYHSFTYLRLIRKPVPTKKVNKIENVDEYIKKLEERLTELENRVSMFDTRLH